MDAILAKLAEMQATLDAQQATITRQQEAIFALQQENAGAQTAPSAAHTLHAVLPERDEATESGGEQSSGLSRRGLLRGAAAATAAAATVGAVTLGATQTAHAAPDAYGDNFILGVNNDAGGGTTYLGSSAVTGFEVAVSGSGNGAIYASTAGVGNGTAVWGYSAQGTAITGQTITGTAIYAKAGGGPGIVAEALGATAIYGTGNIGVVGHGGIGVFGEAPSGIDLKSGGSGRILQIPQSTVGAPTTQDVYSAGESIRDANGDLWLCVAASGMGLGTWVKVAHLAPGYTSGGAITYLSKPVRLFDSRSGATDALFQPGVRCAANSSTTVQVSGDVYNGVTVPASVAGAIGNVTVLNAAGSGFVELVPSGAGFTGAANLAFAPGQIISNAFNVGLNSTGALDIYVGSSAVDVIVDLFAIVA
jgi:hypothetical protein